MHTVIEIYLTTTNARLYHGYAPSYPSVVVPEPYQAGSEVQFNSDGDQLTGWDTYTPIERCIGDPGFRTKKRIYFGGVRTW